MKMFVTRSEAIEQNKDTFSSSCFHNLKLKRTSHDISFENEICNHSSMRCFMKEEYSPDDFSSDSVSDKVSMLVRYEHKIHINKPQHIKAIDQSIKQKYLLSTKKQSTKKETSPITQAMSLPSSHVSRTQSEMQLCEDIAAAEWRDNCMFNRLVNGMKDNQAKRFERRHRSNFPSANATFDLDKNSDPRVERCLMSIVRHRYEDLKEVSSIDALASDSSDHIGEQNIIEPDVEDAFEMFEMDDV